MTIKIQREALVSVINRAPSWTSSTREDMLISYDDEFVLVNLPGKSPCLESPEHRRNSSYSDEDSLCTSSTLSFSSSESLSTERRVSFAPCLVTDEWMRPFTPPEEVSTLHYSMEDTNRFRQEYRLERKVLSELSIDPQSFPLENDELSELICSATPSAPLQMGRHCISRVVILHNNKLETFMKSDEAVQEDEPLSREFFDSPAFWSGAITWY